MGVGSTHGSFNVRSASSSSSSLPASSSFTALFGHCPLFFFLFLFSATSILRPGNVDVKKKRKIMLQKFAGELYYCCTKWIVKIFRSQNYSRLIKFIFLTRCTTCISNSIFIKKKKKGVGGSFLRGSFKKVSVVNS